VANGKVVVITGASHGIGASLVSAYSEAGYNVVGNALSIEPSSNPSIINVPGDLLYTIY
jgi:NAD(P)-dependent dehydrogenase (short-subunit alcohol dehydrogenase family)